MNGNYILDTNIIIALFNEEEHVLRRIEETDAIYLPIIVVAELLYGASCSARKEINLKRINAFLSQNAILDCDVHIAKRFAAVKVELRQNGTPIPDHDIWIAALALHHRLTLVTRDSHFANILGLDILSW